MKMRMHNKLKNKPGKKSEPDRPRPNKSKPKKEKDNQDQIKILHVQGFRRLKFQQRANNYTYIDVPAIKFAGVWLYKYNFKPGDKVKVRAYENKIIITKDGNLPHE